MKLSIFRSRLSVYVVAPPAAGHGNTAGNEVRAVGGGDGGGGSGDGDGVTTLQWIHTNPDSQN